MLSILKRFLIVYFCFTVFLTGCSSPPDEEVLKQQLTAMAEAIENKKAGDVLDHIHPAFLANQEMDLTAAKRLLTVNMLRHNRITLAIPDIQVSLDHMDSDKAEISFTVLMTGAESLWPQSADLQRVHSVWLRDGSDWQLWRLNWK